MWTYASIPVAAKALLLLMALVMVLWFNPRRFAATQWMRKRLRQLALRPWACCAVLVLIALSLNLILTALRAPQPWTHDELAYILAADTFASGRLTNPPHPMWEHFETYHVLSQPTYMAKYPPASAAFMAIGQALTGSPLIGVWLSYLLSIAAVYWMLRGWTTPQWAALGGLLVACHAPMIQAWGQSFWGGSTALLGSALIFGGIRRLLAAKPGHAVQSRDALAIGVGAVVLANTRPMEGLFVFLPVCAILLAWLLRNHSMPVWHKVFRVVAPIALAGLAGLAAMATYNRAVTGSATELPYRLHDHTYSASSLFAFGKLPPVPEYRHPRMREFYLTFGRERQERLQSDWGAFLENLNRKFTLLADFFPLGLAILLLGIAATWRDPWYRLAICVCGGLLLIHSLMATSWMYPHYLAPAMGLFLVLNIECLRRIYSWQRQSRLGRGLVRVAVVFALLKFVPVAASWQARGKTHPHVFVAQELQKLSTVTAAVNGNVASDWVPGPTKHLVFVEYDEDCPIVDDWVYNRADIDAAEIVYARPISDEADARLVAYFRDREVWWLRVGAESRMTLSPWQPALSTQHEPKSSRPLTLDDDTLVRRREPAPDALLIVECEEPAAGAWPLTEEKIPVASAGPLTEARESAAGAMPVTRQSMERGVTDSNLCPDPIHPSL